METVKIGILGLGTVGGGTVNVLQRNADDISRRVGCNIQVVAAAVRDLSGDRICPTDGIDLTDKPQDIINRADVDIVVELIGGDSLAKELVLAAIANGKHVVTANKALIAKYGNEIFAAADKKGVCVAYEAAIAGGIPIVKAMREGLTANKVAWLAGIINGTGNFILTEMRDKGRDFADVLAEAQALGYAEADPEFDVEGIDAAHKLTILASLAFGMPLSFDKCYTEGITKITQQDVTYAEELGYRIKHLGLAVRGESGIELRVHPTLIPEKRLIANVDGVMNAVLVKADAVGPTLYYGPGAGAEPTASAVIADVVDIARTLDGNVEHRVPALAFKTESITEQTVLTSADFETAYYLRLTTEDRPGVMADVTKILADQAISIEAIIQKEPNEDQDATIIMLTHRVIESNMEKAIAELKSQPFLKGDVTRIRVEHLNA
ncbi:MAG: homoserine dehydrogenase [Methylococcales bacterium]|nr:homoserine dehydrogenase [Methylococcales bacterium]